MRAKENRFKNSAWALTERIKELECLYNVSSSIRSNKTISEILQDVVGFIPAAWQYPEITCARISFENEVYRSKGFKESQWVQSADILVKGENKGAVEVYYMEQRPTMDEGPFIKEERRLIQELSELLSEMIDSKNVKEELLAVNQQLISANQQLIDGDQQLRATVQQLTAHEKELITAKEEAEINEKYYHTILNKIGDPVFVKDEQSRLLLVNDAFCQMFDLERTQIIGKTLAEDVAPEERESFLKIDKEVLETGKENINEESLTLRGGNTRTISTRKTPYEDDNGNKFLIGIIRDFTEARKNRDAIKESELKYKTLFDSVPIGLTVADKNGTITESNKMAEALLGLSEEEQKKRKIDGVEWRIIRPDGSPFPQEEYASVKALKENRLVENVEMGIVKNKEEITWINVSAVPFSASNLGVLVTYHDITLRKKAEEQRRLSDERFLTAWNMSPDGFTILKPVRNAQNQICDFTWVYQNTAVAKMNGTYPQDIVGNRLLELFPGHKATKFWNAYVQVAETGEPITFEDAYEGESIALKTWFRIVVVPMDENIAILAQNITASKLAEAKVIAANFELEKTELNAKIGGWSIDVKTMTPYLSRGVREIYEIDPELVLPVEEGIKFYIPEHRPVIEKAVQECMQRGTPYELELEIITAKGNRRWVRTGGSAEIEDDSIVRIAGFLHDITKQKVAEIELQSAFQQLQANEQQLRASFQQLEASEQQLRASNHQLAAHERALIKAKEKAEESEERIKIQNQEVLFNNERLESLLKVAQFQTDSVQELLDYALTQSVDLTRSKIGYIYFYNEEKKQFILNTWSKEVMKECAVMNPQTIYDLDSTGCWGEAVRQRRPIIINDYQAENPLKKGTPEGHVKLEKFLTIPVIVDNKIVAVAGVANKPTDYDQSDVRQLTLLMDSVWKMSERLVLFNDLQAAKEKAEESELQLRYSQKIARIGYYHLDVKTGYWTSSDMLDEIFGIDKDYKKDVEGWINIIHPDFQAEMHNYLYNNILINNENFDKQYKVFNKKLNTSFWVHGLGTLKFNSNGELIKMFGTIQDITLFKELEEYLIHSKEKAEESDRLKSAFLANMSHEIRTPMNGILGFTDLLLKPDLNDGKKEKYIEIIKKSGDRMLNTVNDIIEISKIEAGLIEVRNSRINVSLVVKNLMDFFQIQAQQKGLTLSFESAEVDLFINTDLNKFESILTNLIKNAIKFTNKGRIHISFGVKKGFLQFCVEDTGIGVPQNRIQAIFNRFEQADIEDTQVFQGSGLGLAIAKSYVEILGGKISVTSVEGEGSTFCFTLPYLSDTNTSDSIDTDKSIENNEVQVSQPKILIVEDDEVSADFLKIILNKVAATTMIANSGEKAIEFCKIHSDIDLVLMDIKMPGIDGYEATRRIREFNKEVVIIAQTAYALAGDKEKAITAGCNDYISKPIKQAELIEMITQQLNLKKG